jgi:hypothetical protein
MEINPAVKKISGSAVEMHGETKRGLFETAGVEKSSMVAVAGLNLRDSIFFVRVFGTDPSFCICKNYVIFMK